MSWAPRCSVDDMLSAYESGGCGVIYDHAEHENFLGYVQDSGGSAVGAEVARENNFAGEFAGKLVAPFVHVVKQYPDAWPGPAQRRGDCVSHCCKNALLGTVVLESVLGLPDAVTNKIEEAPAVPIEGQRQGVFSSESIYWHRKKNSDGWMISAAAKVVLSKSGAVIRQPYPEVNLDLTQYSAATAGKWGATPPPDDVVEATNNNLFRTATTLVSVEEWRAYLGKGFFIGTDGGEGFDRQRDENGVSRRRGSWSHSMACIGYDDRPETHSLYGCALALILNSWGKYNTGPRRVRGTDVDIPNGSFWAPVKDFKRRAVAFSGANGWARRSLPDLDPGFV